MKAIEFIKIGTQLDIFFEETSEINKLCTSTVTNIYKILVDPDLGSFINCTVKCNDDEEDEEYVVNLYENDFENSNSEDKWVFTDFQISKLIKENLETTEYVDTLYEMKNNNNYYLGITYLIIGVGLIFNFIYVNK